MKCRVCYSENTLNVGRLKPYLDYECDVFECLDCASRYVEYDESIYDKLHSKSETSYSFHEELAIEVGRYYKEGQSQNIRKILSDVPKFKFVIDCVENQSDICKVLEIGCSKGYLSAYFKSRGHDVIGVDISASAIDFAKQKFGDFFVEAGSPIIAEKMPYDIVVHTGTIGCVESPGKMTENLLKMLKPGGLLIFNAPNVMACKQQNSLWAYGTSPPDLVTLFHEQFWMNNFSDLAKVEISFENVSLSQSLTQYVRGKKEKSQSLKRKKIFSNSQPNQLKGASHKTLRKGLLFFKESMRKILNSAFLSSIVSSLLPKYQSEFGMYIVMKRN